MTFNDIFKSRFLDNITSVSLTDMIVALALAFCVGLFICFIYKKTYAGVLYSSSFAVTLLSLTMITILVILAVTSNVVLSLGMVGALSIVRFRTAVKEPLESAFLFWAIAAGIVLAAGFLPLAVIGSALIGLILVLFANRKENLNPYIAVIVCRDNQSLEEALKEMEQRVKKCVVKSRTASAGRMELNAEIRLKEGGTDFIAVLSELPGVESAALVSFNGAYTG